VVKKAMFRKDKQMNKRTPSPHQKQIRFFTGLSILIIIIITILIFVLANHSSLPIH